MDKAKLEELLEGRETVPVYDESIFEPEKALYELGFTDKDLDDIAEYMRWHVRQRDLHAKAISPDVKPVRQILLKVLEARQKNLVRQRRAKLLAELRDLDRI